MSTEFSFRHSWIQGQRRYHQNWVSLSLSPLLLPSFIPSLLTHSYVNKHAVGDKSLSLLGSKPAGKSQPQHYQQKALCLSHCPDPYITLDRPKCPWRERPIVRDRSLLLDAHVRVIISYSENSAMATIKVVFAATGLPALCPQSIHWCNF